VLYTFYIYIYFLSTGTRKEKKGLSKVTSRHLRRMVHNEFCKIRKQQNINETQCTS